MTETAKILFHALEGYKELREAITPEKVNSMSDAEREMLQKKLTDSMESLTALQNALVDRTQITGDIKDLYQQVLNALVDEKAPLLSKK